MAGPKYNLCNLEELCHTITLGCNYLFTIGSCFCEMKIKMLTRDMHETEGLSHYLDSQVLLLPPPPLCALLTACLCPQRHPPPFSDVHNM